MSRIDLHKFRDDLKRRPGLGDMSPPRTIRALNLDENYSKVTLLEGEGNPKLYEVKYTKDGTRITRILPQGSNKGDLLYWDGSQWKVFPAVADSTLRVLTIQNNVLAWTPTQDC